MSRRDCRLILDVDTPDTQNPEVAMPTYGRAVVLAEVGAPLEIREYPVPDPEPGAAIIRVSPLRK